MKRSTVARLLFGSFIWILISLFVVCIYYNLINTEHKGMMDLWAILLLVIPFVIMSVMMIIARIENITLKDAFKSENNGIKTERIINEIIEFIGFVIFLPIVIIFMIFYIIKLLFTSDKRRFNKLINKGFKYKKNDGFYVLSKDNTIVKISFSFELFFISFDKDETLENIYDANIGTEYERQKLKKFLDDYIQAPSIYKQKGDVVPPIYEYIEFLNYYLV